MTLKKSPKPIKNSKPIQQPNCFECTFHFITHERGRPYGCQQFGFKGQFLPSRHVFEATGMKCAYFQPRKAPVRRRSSS